MGQKWHISTAMINGAQDPYRGDNLARCKRFFVDDAISG